MIRVCQFVASLVIKVNGTGGSVCVCGPSENCAVVTGQTVTSRHNTALTPPLHPGRCKVVFCVFFLTTKAALKS